jgi:hypothetical protein
MEPQSLDLIVLDSGVPTHVVALGRAGSDLALVRIACAELLADLDDFRGRIDRALRGRERRPLANDLLDFGRRLFAFLIRDDLARIYSRLPADDVRIRIISDRPDLQSIPWEYFQDPARPGGPALERSIVRIVPTIGRPFVGPLLLRQNRPLRVLFVSADPVDQEAVSWPELKEDVEATFAAFIRGRAELTAVEGTDRDALTDAVQSGSYDIFHFSGHGTVVDGVGQIVLVNRDDGRSSLLSGEELGRLLAGRGIRLAILSACETAAGNFAEDFAVTATSLIQAGVPAVIANQLPVPDQTVATFAGAVYRKLLACGDVDLAVTEGRVKLSVAFASPASAALEWGIPALYRHIDASQLLALS